MTFWESSPLVSYRIATSPGPKPNASPPVLLRKFPRMMAKSVGGFILTAEIPPPLVPPSP